MTLQACRFALDPTPTQVRMLRSHAGAARVGFNWGLAHVKAVMGQRGAEATSLGTRTCRSSSVLMPGLCGRWWPCSPLVGCAWAKFAMLTLCVTASENRGIAPN